MEHGYAARQLKIKKTARKKRHARGPHTCCTTGTMTHTALKFFLILATDCKILLPSLSVCVCVRERQQKNQIEDKSHTHTVDTHTLVYTHTIERQPPARLVALLWLSKGAPKAKVDRNSQRHTHSWFFVSQNSNS